MKGRVLLIGGTNLRLIHGIDRFSEDLDFDCKEMSKEEFLQMTDSLEFLKARNGIPTFEELRTAISKMLEQVDLNQKKKDFAHLLFNENNAERILHFQEIVKSSLR